MPLSNVDLENWCKYLDIPLKGIFLRNEAKTPAPFTLHNQPGRFRKFGHTLGLLLEGERHGRFRFLRAATPRQVGEGNAKIGLVSQGVLVPKFATDTKFLKAFGKAIPQHRDIVDVFKKTLRNYYGTGVDIHSLIGKLPAPKKGWTLPGYNYSVPFNPLDRQLSFDPQIGEILEVFQQPTGPSDAVAMQHDVDYSSYSFRAEKSGEDEKKCKHVADRKMVKALDAIPRNRRQYGHSLARNAINTKQKLGLGV